MERLSDTALIARGGDLFEKNCASCHGAGAEGNPNWRKREADGFFPAPPLNGTGHAWHHPQKMLHYVIKYGAPNGEGRMQPWGDRLSDEDIDAIISWFKAKWPEEVYEAWYRMDQKRTGG